MSSTAEIASSNCWEGSAIPIGVLLLLTGKGFPFSLCNQHWIELESVPTSLSWLKNELFNPLLQVVVV